MRVLGFVLALLAGAMHMRAVSNSLAMRIIGAAFLLITLPAQVWAGFEEGEAAFVRGDYTEAHREWMPLAVEGDARAQWGVAHLYLLGLGVMQDVAVSAQWAKKSADQGYVEGLSLLADLYQRGVGDQTGPAARCVELIGKAVGGGMFIDRHQVGQDTLSREQLIEALAEGDPTRRKIAEQLLNAPRNFEEGANEATRKLAKLTG